MCSGTVSLATPCRSVCGGTITSERAAGEWHRLPSHGRSVDKWCRPADLPSEARGFAHGAGRTSLPRSPRCDGRCGCAAANNPPAPPSGTTHGCAATASRCRPVPSTDDRGQQHHCLHVQLLRDAGCGLFNARCAASAAGGDAAGRGPASATGPERLGTHGWCGRTSFRQLNRLRGSVSFRGFSDVADGAWALAASGGSSPVAVSLSAAASTAIARAVDQPLGSAAAATATPSASLPPVPDAPIALCRSLAGPLDHLRGALAP